MTKETKRYITALRRLGLDVEQTKGGHFAIYRDGRRIGSFPLTPSDSNWIRQSIRDLRRYHGIEVTL